jgi:hypothetical protein
VILLLPSERFAWSVREDFDGWMTTTITFTHFDVVGTAFEKESWVLLRK